MILKPALKKATERGLFKLCQPGNPTAALHCIGAASVIKFFIVNCEVIV